MVVANNHLVKVIIDMAIFLEYSSPDYLSEDAAIETMEQMAAELQQIKKEDREKLSKQIVGFASLYEQPQKAFVRELPQALGLL